MKKIKLYLAPIQGFTNSLYRNLFSEYFTGFDLAVAPFIASVQAKQIGRSHIKDILPENNSGMPVIPQILSNDPDGFIQLASVLFDLGYDTVNWNLGCPFPIVARKKRGSGFLPYTKEIGSFLDKVIPAIPNRLSIKTRTGWKNSSDILDLIPVFNRYPISEIIIHPRIGIQRYEGEPDLDIFEKCLALSDHRVAYNGNIENLESFRFLSARFPKVDRWMIGRFALSNPFLPDIIKKDNDTIQDKTVVFKKFHDELVYRYSLILSGPSHILDKMKGYWNFFSCSFEDGRKIYKKIKKAKNPDQFKRVVDTFFAETPRWIESLPPVFPSSSLTSPSRT